jgi:hypothetical protein
VALEAIFFLKRMLVLHQLKNGNKSKVYFPYLFSSLGQKLDEKFTNEDKEARELRI